MRAGELVFVDTGAWIALALTRDPRHAQAREVWEDLQALGARLLTSVPVLLETFTFLDRNTQRDVALVWKDALGQIPRLEILPVGRAELADAWPYFERRDLHKLSSVDATSFVLMARERIQTVFSFDPHFAMAGFRLAG